MSQPKTIWWCVRHNRQATHRWMNPKAGRWVCDWCDSFGVMGQAIEVELHPVGTRAEIARTRAFFDPDGEVDDVEIV